MYSIDDISRLTGAVRCGRAEGSVEWLLTDSRSLSFAETTLFFALHTERGRSGAAYVGGLRARGVRHFVVDRRDADLLHAQGLPMEGDEPAADINMLWVDNATVALQTLAARHRDRYHGIVVGITGSNGKTVVKEWLAQLLSPDRRVVRSPRSYNSQIGVPLSVWQLSPRADIALIEAGISRPGEMAALQRIVRPDIGVLTHLGPAHQENFGTGREKAMEKLGLFREAGMTIYHRDDRLTALCVGAAGLADRSLSISRQTDRGDLQVTSVVRDTHSTHIAYVYRGVSGDYVLPFVDEASVENSLTCLAVCLYLGISADEVARRMERLEPVAMRLEVKEGMADCTLINDSYNSDLPSLDVALDFATRRQAGEGAEAKTLSLVLSDMEQTGLEPDELYGQIAAVVGRWRVDRLIGIGPQMSAAADRFAAPTKLFYPSTEAAVAAVDAGALRFSHEIVLLKGARRYGLEALTERLLRRVHETTLEVNLSAMVANLNHYRSMLRPATKVVCMVKADAYGAGALEVAKTLQEHHVDYLAVAVADEGAELRRAGITTPIMVMNPELSAFKTMFDYTLEPEVYSFHLLDALLQAARREGVAHHPIHIKIDTGMHRLGFAPTDVEALIDRLRGQDALIVRSVFSHLAGSDTAGLEDFTRQQIDRFSQSAEQLQSAFDHRILRHICNTAGIARFGDYQYEMVRLGIGLYGVDPFTNHIIHNVSTLRTTILQIRDVMAGDTVGYGRRGQVSRPSRIAALPIGYADGLNRHIGNGRGYCIVNEQPASYVGNICMDVCMVDVTDIDCHEGDRVEIFGDRLPVTVIADRLNTIAYEVLTGISTRVKRVYYQD